MENRKVKVRNRNGGITAYSIPELHVTREFRNEEIKPIDSDEIIRLSNIDGGMYILKHNLVINDAELLEELGLQVEPEYYYTEEDVKRILLTGSYDELDDMLNFAPEGVLTMAARLATNLEIPDIHKRDTIGKRLGINVSGAIEINHLYDDTNAEAGKSAEESAPKRKVPAPAATPVRKVVKKAE